jgi:inositol transporter-like SP family MFS transporter
VYDAAGFSSATGQNALQVLVWGCTCLATFFGFMRYADTVSRRVLYVVGATMGVLAWALLSYAEGSLAVLLVFAVVWGTSAGIGAQAFYSVWTSELFATRYRATAQGVLFFAARIAVGLLSYVFPTLLAQQGVPFVGTLMIGFLLVALVVGAVWAPDTQGKSLTQIERERYGDPSGAAAPGGRDQHPDHLGAPR